MFIATFQGILRNVQSRIQCLFFVSFLNHLLLWRTQQMWNYTITRHSWSFNCSHCMKHKMRTAFVSSPKSLPKAIYSTDHYQTQRAWLLWLQKNIFTPAEHTYQILHWAKEEQELFGQCTSVYGLFRWLVRAVFIKWQKIPKMHLLVSLSIMCLIVVVHCNVFHFMTGHAVVT